MAVGGELQTLIEKALKSSPKVEQAQRELNYSKFQVKKAYGNYLPEVDFNYTYTDLSKVPSYSMALPGIPAPPTSFNLFKKKFFKSSLEVKVPLFTGGRILNLIKVEKSKEKAYRLYLKEVKNLVVAQVKTDYYQVLRAKALVETARRSLKSAKEHYKVVKAFFDEGIVPRRDLLEAEVKVSQAKEELKRAEGLYEVALEKLRVDSGVFGFTPKGELPKEVKERSFKVSNLIERALKERPAVKEVEALVEGTKRGVKLAESQFMPQVFFEASYSKTSQYPLNGIFSNKSAAIGISVPIFKGTKRFWEVKEAKEEELKALAKLREVKREVRLQVVSAYTQLETAKRRIEAARKEVEEAKELLRDSKERYKEHVGTSTEVVDAIAYLTRARASLVNAIADYLTALTRLEYSVGGRL